MDICPVFGVFTELWKALSWLSVCLSIHPSIHMEQLSSHLTDFHEILHSKIFKKSFENIQVSLKSD
jgi:hypothetical protein